MFPLILLSDTQQMQVFSLNNSFRVAVDGTLQVQLFPNLTGLNGTTEREYLLILYGSVGIVVPLPL